MLKVMFCPIISFDFPNLLSYISEKKNLKGEETDQVCHLACLTVVGFVVYYYFYCEANPVWKQLDGLSSAFTC